MVAKRKYSNCPSQFLDLVASFTKLVVWFCFFFFNFFGCCQCGQNI